MGLLNEPVSAKGLDGTISFDGRAVTIARSGFNARVQHGSGNTVIPIGQVTGVEFKPQTLTKGRITILTPGSVQRKGGGRAHVNDPMSVEFMRQGDQFVAVRDAINAALLAPAGTAASPAAGEVPLEARLAELGRLRADGVLTDDEFVAAKARLLG